MKYSSAALVLLTPALATLQVYDPSNTIDPSVWAADNALIANFSIIEPSYQHIAVDGPYFYTNDSVTTLSRQVLTGSDNDTSVLVVTEGANMTVDRTTIIKSGYATSLVQSSFFGIVFLSIGLEQ